MREVVNEDESILLRRNRTRAKDYMCHMLEVWQRRNFAFGTLCGLVAKTMVHREPCGKGEISHVPHF